MVVGEGVVSRNCRRCNKEFVPIGKSSHFVYCSSSCRALDYAKNSYYANRDKPHYVEMNKMNMRRWYENNREHQKNNVLRYYARHKGDFYVRSKVSKNKHKILSFLPSSCFVCGKSPVSIVSLINPSKEYFISIRDMPLSNMEKIKFFAVNNCRALCSRYCWGKIRRGRKQSKDGAV